MRASLVVSPTFCSHIFMGTDELLDVLKTEIWPLRDDRSPISKIGR